MDGLDPYFASRLKGYADLQQAFYTYCKETPQQTPDSQYPVMYSIRVSTNELPFSSDLIGHFFPEDKQEKLKEAYLVADPKSYCFTVSREEMYNVFYANHLKVTSSFQQPVFTDTTRTLKGTLQAFLQPLPKVDPKTHLISTIYSHIMGIISKLVFLVLRIMRLIYQLFAEAPSDLVVFTPKKSQIHPLVDLLNKELTKDTLSDSDRKNIETCLETAKKTSFFVSSRTDTDHLNQTGGFTMMEFSYSLFPLYGLPKMTVDNRRELLPSI